MGHHTHEYMENPRKIQSHQLLFQELLDISEEVVCAKILLKIIAHKAFILP